ncbi:MAG: hypothetical protein R3C99_17730 [Pirellulaceae bacterium]
MLVGSLIATAAPSQTFGGRPLRPNLLFDITVNASRTDRRPPTSQAFPAMWRDDDSRSDPRADFLKHNRRLNPRANLAIANLLQIMLALVIDKLHNLERVTAFRNKSIGVVVDRFRQGG